MLKKLLTSIFILSTFLLYSCNCDDTGLTTLFPKATIKNPDGQMKETADGYELDFGDVLVGSLKMIELEISNSGESELIIDQLQVTGSEEFSSKLQETKILPNKKTGLQITYAPQNKGADTGTLTFSTNDKEKKTVKINLKGNGVLADIEVCLTDENKCNEDKTDTLSIDFGQITYGGESKKYGFSVANKGDYKLSV